MQVLRRSDLHDLRDLTIAVRFEGDYDTSFTDGDNSAVLPTDTMKNTVYALAAREPVQEPESFGQRLARHFLSQNDRLTRVTVDLVEHLWGRIARGERQHGNAFVRRGPETRTAVVTGDRVCTRVSAGASDLVIMLEGGVYPPPSQFEAWFLSAAHSEKDVDKTIKVARKAMKAVPT